MRNLRKDDQAAVMQEVDPLVPVILRQSLDEGFHQFTMNRRSDPAAFIEYSDCTRGNLLYDRVAGALRKLIGEMANEVPGLAWKISSNRRATDIYLGTRFAFRIKRTKRNRNGCSTSVLTGRQRMIKSFTTLSVGQLVLPYRVDTAIVPDAQRIWLTVGFDLDDLEESIETASIGVELLNKFLWKVPLPAPDVDVIADLSPSLANRISELRRKSA